MSDSIPVTVPARVDYQRLLQGSKQEIAALKLLHVRMVWLRTVLFVLAAPCLLFGYGGETYRLLLLTIGWMAATGFLVAIVWHEHLRLARERHESDVRLFRRLLARLDRDWDELPAQRLLPEFEALPYADDLDIAGSASLLSLLSLAGTLPGRHTLQQWLATPPTWHELQTRQSAVKVLTPQRTLRLSIIKTILSSSDGSEDVYGLPKWGATPNWLSKHRVAHALSYLGPTLVAIGLGMLAIFGIQENVRLINVAAIIAGLGLLLNILVTVAWGSWIHDIFQSVTGQHRAVYQFADVFASLKALPHDNGVLDDIRQKTTEGPTCATKGFPSLLRIVNLANLQRTPVFYLVYLVLQLVLLWDFRILKMLERWKADYGQYIGGWFKALGQCEALISSAFLADEYPNWNYPQPIENATLRLKALSLGHPLLSDQARVVNDMELATDRPLLLVTGSNMAGKSTFMRALGLNLLLARTGSPVCADAFDCHLFELATSIRVRDSLRDGVSFFMAELKRLKEVVDLAQKHFRLRATSLETAGQGGAPPILFLLDEVLQGTNSRERQIAVASVLDKLLKSGACGLVTTHDLDLAAADEMKKVSQIVHFREHFESVGGQEVMQFDYIMRPGPTPTTNALKLLKLVGLDAEA